MIKYAKIIVDIPFKKGEKAFDYRIPPDLADSIGIGNLVEVPFGNRMIKGFVIEISKSSSLDKKRIKNIKGLLKEISFFNKYDLKLYRWLADYYNLNLISVIRAAIPSGIITGRISKKRKNYIKLKYKKNRTEKIIEEIENKAPKQAAVLRVLLDNSDKNYIKSSLAKKADSYPGAVKNLLEKGYLKEVEDIEIRSPYLEERKTEKEPFQANYFQKKAIKEIELYIGDNGRSDVFLLHGVTGSGKTEVYLQLVEKVLKKEQGAIILVPEIALAPVMVRKFYSRFGAEIAVLHSNLSQGERYDQWRRLKNGEAQIAIGARSAVFAPVQNLGLIIIDEEHETSYKQSSYPYYHAREVAIKRAKIYGIPLILGTATPSLKSFYLAEKGYFKYISLPERINQKEMPPVELIDMRDEIDKGNLSIFSGKLKDSIDRALARDEQVLLFLNRRGYSSFVLCRECGHVVKCKNCDISLTYHDKESLLRCHYCDYSRKIPANCPECGSKYIKKFGIGTEKLEEEVKKYFPEAVVDRMDVDTTSTKGAHREILDRLEKNKTDILIGTQMIAKGHDYPGISVVGVITADTILNLPDFRSSERTFQLITQVAGRTGRGSKKGKVIVQTYTPGHYSLKAAQNHDYESFSKKELKLRAQLNYPPFSKLVNIIVLGKDDELTRKAVLDLDRFLQKDNKKIDEILGPSPAPIERIRNKYRWQIILKFNKYKERNSVLKGISKNFFPYNNDKVNFNIDVDPLSML